MVSKKQILVTGCYRSGTEYFSLTLGNHPRIVSTMYVLNFMRTAFGQYDPLSEERNICFLVGDLTARARTRWNVKLPLHKILDRIFSSSERSYGTIYDAIMSETFFDDRSGADMWSEKTQLVWRSIPDFLKEMNNGFVVHVVRDPRGVLASFKNFTYAPSPAYLGAILNSLDSLKKALEYQANYCASQYMIVRAEDLADNPAGVFSRVFEQLDCSLEASQIEKVIEEQVGAVPFAGNSSFGAPLNQRGGRDAKWRDELEPWEISLCEAVCGEVMDAFGYTQLHGQRDASLVKVLSELHGDSTLSERFLRWASSGEGMEEFPSDPLVPENWSENQ